MGNIQRIEIPNEIRRKLRQEAGFGCCFCGFPFIEYHHIISYATRPEHHIEDMMVVCSRCHDVITAGAIPESEQRIAKSRPHNRRCNETTGELFLRRQTVSVGGTHFRCNGPLIVADHEPIVQTLHDEYDNLQLSAILRDKQDNLLAELVSNEWVIRPDSTWDMEARPRSLIIRHATRQILLKLKVVEEVVQLTGTFWKSGKQICFDNKPLTIGGNPNSSIQRCSNCIIAVNTQENTQVVRLGPGLHPNQPYNRNLH